MGGVVALPHALAAYPGDNGRIVFSSSRPGAVPGSRYDIYTTRPDGTGMLELTSTANDDLYPVWSPDSSHILFTRLATDSPGTQSDIWVMDADGGNPTQLTTAAGRDEQATWSPDGSTIAFASDRTGSYNVWTIAVATGTETQLTDESMATAPAWSPDGAQIAYVSDNDGHNQIYAMDANGSNKHVLVPSDPGVQDNEPDWSPDGTAVTFSRFIYPVFTHSSAIYAADADGSNVHLVIDRESGDNEPAYSPDGTQITFQSLTSSLNGNFDVYTVPVDGGTASNITVNDEADWQPSWGSADAAPPTHQLTVSKLGNGTGSITSTDTHIDCGSTCSASYADGASVTLSAMADAGSKFSGWAGDCATALGPSCTLTMSADHTVSAYFTKTAVLTVTFAGAGSGNVTGIGLSCSTSCTHIYNDGSGFTLTESPGVKSTFEGWSGGGCSGTATTCDVTLNGDTRVTVTFAPVSYSLSVSLIGNGSGSVSSAPTGIACPATACSASYVHDTPVTLTATPATGSTFTGWAGPCSGTGTCDVPMSGATGVSAQFTKQSFLLSVATAGSGSGTVTSTPNGISCGATCSASFVYQTSVSLTPTPAFGSTFTGWTGACSGTGACSVTMDQARSVTATFGLTSFQLSVSLAGTGTGTVTSSPAGISCGVTCTASYDFNTTVTLTATPAAGSTFTAWGGQCTVVSGQCQVSMLAAKSVTALFTQPTFGLTVTKFGTGSGTVSSTPAGINCGPTCSSSYANGTVVTLTATPAAGSFFSGWSSACTGTGSCVVTMDQARSVFATFAITPSNRPPTAQSQTVVLPEDTAKAITLVATDPDVGQTLTYRLATQPAHGLLTGTPPNVTYMPTANYNGSDSFSFTASDGTATSAPATVTIAVNPVNDPPIAVNQAITTAEDTPATFTFSASDVDGDPLTYSMFPNPAAHGIVTNVGPSATYAPTKDYYGPDSFQWQVSDGALIAHGTVTITVTPVGDLPTIWLPFTLFDYEGSSGEFSHSFSDPDGQAAADFTVTFDWGDGTTTRVTPASYGGGDYGVDVFHTYKRFGHYAIKVTTADKRDGSVAVTDAESIRDEVLVGGSFSTPGTGSANQAWGPFVVGCVQDDNSYGLVGDLSASIKWGDGKTSTGLSLRAVKKGDPCAAPFDFVATGSHTYTKAGTYTQTVTFTSVGGSRATFTGKVKIS